MTAERRTVVLRRLSVPGLARGSTHLEDVLRECHLVVVDRDLGRLVAEDLIAAASALIVDLPLAYDIYTGSEMVPVDADHVDAHVELEPGAVDLAERLLAHLPTIERAAAEGRLLLVPDPASTELVCGVWRSIVDQLRGASHRSGDGEA